jgi:FtsH-binding integral membrane protein
MIALTLSICAIILTAAVNDPMLHMIASGAVSLVFAATAIREHNTLRAAGASKSVIGSSTARNTGLVWAWGALGIFVTYAFILQQRWPEWWHFFLGFALAAIASIIFSNMLDRDAKADRVDDSVMKVGRTLVLVQLAGVLVAIVSMFIDGKFPRAASYPDWAGCNIFFFGALAIAAISLDALRTAKDA